jgi:hypothetical protein
MMIVFHRLRNVISTALTLNNPANQVVESVEYNNNPPPYNPTQPDMHGSTETVNKSDADSTSNRLLRPDETLNNNDVSGAYEKIETEFGEHFIFGVLPSCTRFYTLKANSKFLNCCA